MIKLGDLIVSTGFTVGWDTKTFSAMIFRENTVGIVIELGLFNMPGAMTVQTPDGSFSCYLHHARWDYV